MQTSQLHKIPLVKACKKVSDVLAEAMPIAVPGLDTTPPCTAKNTINSDLAKTGANKTTKYRVECNHFSTLSLGNFVPYMLYYGINRLDVVGLLFSK